MLFNNMNTHWRIVFVSFLNYSLNVIFHMKVDTKSIFRPIQYIRSFVRFCISIHHPAASSKITKNKKNRGQKTCLQGPWAMMHVFVLIYLYIICYCFLKIYLLNWTVWYIYLFLPKFYQLMSLFSFTLCSGFFL